MGSNNKEVLFTEVYTFAMPKHVYIQLNGVQAPAKITADKVEEERNASEVIVKKGDETVGKFKGPAVAGWWIEDE